MINLFRKAESQSTVQDLGRFGHYHIGMPPSGAMDKYAHTVANYLVGNEADAATIEMTYQGITATFDEDDVIAITGADMSPSLNGESIGTWETVAVDAGDELELAFATEGARAYLAVAGRIDVPEVMGSRSTYTLVGIGGHEGRSLEEETNCRSARPTTPRPTWSGRNSTTSTFRRMLTKTPSVSSSVSRTTD